MFHILVVFVIAGTVSSEWINATVLKVEGVESSGGSEEKIRICDAQNREFEELATFLGTKLNLTVTVALYSCRNIGQRSELTVLSESAWSLDHGSWKTVFTTPEGKEYSLSVANTQDVNCEGVLLWDEEAKICGCLLGDYSSVNMQYVEESPGKYIVPTQEIAIKCESDRYFSDYSSTQSVSCDPRTDLARYICQTEEELKHFDNKVAHFEGTLDSYVIMDQPFQQELEEFALCFWLRTNDAVGSIFSLANEDHWNALRFDTHTSHIHFTMAGLHTDHGLVPKIRLVDRDWRYFCASWRSSDGNATVLVRKHGENLLSSFSEILPLSVGKKVRATGGKVALGNLWKEDVVTMEFNPVGSLAGDVMGLTLFNTTVGWDTFNAMFDGCSTVLDQSAVVLSWKGLMDGANNQVKVSATFGEQVCSKGYVYGESGLDFPVSHRTYHLSNNLQNYAKIENAFSVDLTEFTICAIIKSDIKIGTIFSYVTTLGGFTEQIVLEKHKTHMHFYMAGVDQQVGAVPSIAIDTLRWYSTCFTWDNTGRWRGYLDGTEITTDTTAPLQYTEGKTISGGGTCYLGILKTFNSFREYRGYGGDITELNLWGKALSAEQIKSMVKSNKVYEADLLVGWGTLLEHKRGDMISLNNDLCPGPGLPANSSFTKTGTSSLYQENDQVSYSCTGVSALLPGISDSRTCEREDGQLKWIPQEPIQCVACEEAGYYECPLERCIPQSLVCDGRADCDSGQDEQNCPNKQVYWIVIGVLAGLILLSVPSVILLKKVKAAREEARRVKLLTDDWEVKREHLQLEEKLGEGAFGKVYKGFLLQKPKFEVTTVVAVKELSDIATERDRNMFLEEIRLSKKLGNHPNIVGIVGSIIVYQPNCLILEYVDGGDMLEYLQKNRENPNCTISQEDQVFFAWQIANGMEYVSSKNFVHRDLAARNVLISTGKQCKVTDFGLARDLYNYDEYQSEGGRLPIKWMSPEAIFDLKFTTESDVWSFGIVMYELFSWGGSPYPGIDPAQLREKLVSGFRMSAPNDTPDFIYSIMLQCWEFKSSDRPSFANIRTFIEQEINDYQPFVDFKVDVASEYINMAETESRLQIEEAPHHQEARTEHPISGTTQAPTDTTLVPTAGPSCGAQEYTNLKIQGEHVVYKNDYEQTTAPAKTVQTEVLVNYAAVERVAAPDVPNIQPVNVGFVDENGMAEITRSDYMNTG